jgi:3-phenylpropionate/cinnamic acid dioxygenase small subunit
MKKVAKKAAAPRTARSSVARPSGSRKSAATAGAARRVAAGKTIARPAKTAKPADARALQHEIEQFLYAQANLLDAKHWQDYIDLFADDGLYWMPASPEQTTWDGVPSIFAEDRHLMAVRMKRVLHPDAWSQRPLWGTNHIVGNVVIESANAREVVVRSRFHMMELRRDDVRHFAGSYLHRLRSTPQGWRIVVQRVDMANAQAVFDYVLQVWV